MTVKLLDEMTWEEVRDLDRSRTVAILPLGAIEAHGPHLPLSTDVIIAVAMARSGAQRLVKAGYEALLLPPLSYTAAPFASAFPGTLSVDSAAVRAILEGVAHDLGSQGFAALALASAHLDPSHVGMLRDAVRALRNGPSAPIPVIFPDITRRTLAARLTDEFRSGACHAGRFETSIVMAERPELVVEEVRAALPPVPRSLTVAIAEGLGSFEEAGGTRAYFGAPAEASAEEGRASVATLGSLLYEAVLETLEGG